MASAVQKVDHVTHPINLNSREVNLLEKIEAYLLSYTINFFANIKFHGG